MSSLRHFTGISRLLWMASKGTPQHCSCDAVIFKMLAKEHTETESIISKLEFVAAKLERDCYQALFCPIKN